MSTPDSILPIKPVASEISNYLKLHERLIIIVLSVVLLWGLYSKGVAYLASRDQLASNKAVTVLQAQVDVNAKEAEDAKQTLLEYQQLAQQLIASNKAVQAAQQQRAVETQKQQAVDKTLPPPALAARWTSLLNVSPETVQPSTVGYSVTPDTAVSTVVQLESIPQLKADLQGAQTIEDNQGKQIDGQGILVTSLNTQIEGLNKQVIDQNNACIAQVTLVKAQARKSKLRWFIIGYVAGFITREIIKP